VSKRVGWRRVSVRWSGSLSYRVRLLSDREHGPGPAPALRVLVTGSRTWERPDLVWAALDRLAEHRPVTLTVVHGAAPRGADRHAAAWVANGRRLGYLVVEEAHPARTGAATGGPPATDGTCGWWPPEPTYA
jgi:hypothetical protein